MLTSLGVLWCTFLLDFSCSKLLIFVLLRPEPIIKNTFELTKGVEIKLGVELTVVPSEIN